VGQDMVTVFLSHSSKDKSFVRKLAKALDEKGIPTWLDEVDIRVGDSIPEEIGRAINRCDLFCIVISSNSNGSVWVQRELNSYVPKMIRKQGKILPCLIEQVDLPPLLSDLKYANFSQSFDDGFHELLRVLEIQQELERQNRAKEEREGFANLLTAEEVSLFLQRFRAYGYHTVYLDPSLFSARALLRSILSSKSLSQTRGCRNSRLELG
jgi:hypothetical protein